MFYLPAGLVTIIDLLCGLSSSGGAGTDDPPATRPTGQPAGARGRSPRKKIFFVAGDKSEAEQSQRTQRLPTGGHNNTINAFFCCSECRIFAFFPADEILGFPGKTETEYNIKHDIGCRKGRRKVAVYRYVIDDNGFNIT